MQIVEYKKYKTREGQIVNPEWLTYSGFFYNSADKTYIGVIDDEDDREYYVPDTVSVLTKLELITRYNSLSEEDKTASGYTDPDVWHSQFILKIKILPTE